MKWGRRWGTLNVEKGFKKPTLWGGEIEDGVTALSGRRLKVVKIKGIISPCDSCKRISRCAMYQSFMRKRASAGEYSQGTNILHMCDIYIPNSSPGSITGYDRVRGKTSGKQPT